MSESNIISTSLPLPYVASFIRSNNRTFLPYINPSPASHQTPIPLSLSLSALLYTFLHSSLTMPSSFSPNPISPSRLRSDLYSFSCEDEPTTPLVISVLASLVERTIARNERAIGECSIVAVKDARSRTFYSHQILEMSIQSFLERFFRYARVAPPVYVVAYVYMERLCQLNPGLKVCLMNVHRLLITSIMVASKFVEDRKVKPWLFDSTRINDVQKIFDTASTESCYIRNSIQVGNDWIVAYGAVNIVILTPSRNYRNSYFAKVGGISTMELNNLELNFLFLMKFKLHVSVSVFESYCSHLEREVSFGGGYHIERSLKFMCGGEITSKERERRELTQPARVL